MRRGVERFGLRDYIVLDEHGDIPLGDHAFDVVWCNSVIEHVMVSRAELAFLTGREFRRRARLRQRRFAEEIRRIARQYFVQTPYVHFPIQSHSWLPFTQYLSGPLAMRVAKPIKRIWIKQFSGGGLLCNRTRFEDDFPDATAIRMERMLGLPKSLIAIRQAVPAAVEPAGASAREAEAY